MTHLNNGSYKLFPVNKSFTNHIYLTCMYKQDLALNNLQELLCRKTQPTNLTTNHLTGRK